ncbi:hypothetical protein CC80DRAFT_545576 [Byssothecium circinans]|uniref:Uncharacterized protein n=1 Tax=Byssothecium circinans TaxID=147558 RepID=A0A6A5U3E6_9PLEO|nr:hypothetical protein CC80DRAFT_545576 [Byssothecium circinans]
MSSTSRRPRLVKADFDTVLLPIIPNPASFVSGWMSLPDELKRQVLGHNLTSSSPVRLEDARANSGLNEIFMLRHHMHTTSEIASLAREVFYKTNTFELTADINRNYYRYTEFHLPLPGPTVRPLIFRLEYNFYFRWPDWDMFYRLMQGDYGLTGLKHVTVFVTWHFLNCTRSRPANFQELLQLTGFKYDVVLPVKGKVVFGRDLSKTLNDHYNGAVEEMVRAKFQFGKLE